MPANKNYSTREQVIDEMLRSERGASLKEMMERCNQVLGNNEYRITALNTITNDLINIENKYGVTIEKIKDPDDRRIIRHRYVNRDFSIFKVDVTPSETECLRAAMQILTRFQGLPQNNWISEMDVRVSTFLKNESYGRPIVGFDTNPNYTGNRHLRPLYDHIRSNQTLTITWSLPGGMVLESNVWPYYLRQSGHTWHLIAANVKNGQLDSYALDRISQICKSDIPYKPCETDLDSYFKQRIGATSSLEYRDPVTVTFKADAIVRQNLEAAPLHPSQHITKTLADGSVIMEMTVIYTIEMLHELCKYCEGITVLSPIDLRYSVARYHAEALDNYGYPVDYELFETVLTDSQEK